MKAYDVVSLLELQIACCNTQADAAKMIGISPQYLHDVLNHHRSPGKKILDWLGLEKEVVYQEKNRTTVQL